MISLISLEELTDVITNLPKGKAHSPTNITYEDIQLLFPATKELLLELFNNILEIMVIPDDWLKTNIYLILKPKP
ncbi:hypothetical protein RclHR1_05020006 [Rhizophagus clarus]|uniref:Uncharacterized protein n=1 Tax=Rhizophagus clarus TaxID=94130 RepID=A0A2Z6SE58_9GLOM|nr:hypothetical protein RclHR1_05020006 [Rhizophagus clarus]